MLKILSLAVLSAMVLGTKNNCNSKKSSTNNTTCYKGRLEIKGICSNYTIKVIDGNIDTTLVQSNWQDEQTNKSYTNVFALGNPCTFPADVKEGDEFYFTIDTTTNQKDCMVCMAYYPTPAKKLAINVSKNPCP